MRETPKLPRHILEGQVLDLKFDQIVPHIVLMVSESKPNSISGTNLINGEVVKLRVEDGFVYNYGNWCAVSIDLLTPAEARAFIQQRPQQMEEEAKELQARATLLRLGAHKYREISNSLIATLPKEVA